MTTKTPNDAETIKDYLAQPEPPWDESDADSLGVAWGERELQRCMAEGMSRMEARGWVKREALGLALLITGFEVLRRVAHGIEPIWDIDDKIGDAR